MSADAKVTEDGVTDSITPPGRPFALNTPFIQDWDRYKLLGHLGRGGMGTVYRAQDLKNDREVALKFVLGTDPRMTRRLVHEASAQSRIDHPNICRVYEIGEEMGQSYIAMQLVDGISLCKAAEQMSVDEKVGVLREAALAVHEAHRQGIVHRDLKPANILVERRNGRWHPFVMDFGLARETSVQIDSGESGFLLGTPPYMSPEQARGDARLVDRRSDVYGLGATLYELLTGRPPFVDGSTAAILTRLVGEEPMGPRGLVPSIPLELETIVLKCLEKDPDRRYASARALADDLGRYLDGIPIFGRRSSRWRRFHARVRTHRLLAATLGISILAVVGASAIGIRAHLRSLEEAEVSETRARIAERLGEQIEQIEGYMREANLRPLHDVRVDRGVIRDRLRAIGASRVAAVQVGAEGYVDAALGRGHLALREWPEAIEALRAAESEGVESADVHAALGRALGEMYLRSADGADRSPEDKEVLPAWLASRRADLTRRYLEPARAQIARGFVERADSEILRARLSLYGRDFEDAERRARQVATSDPSSSEALQIAGSAARLRASARMDRGDFEGALPMLRRAADAYDRAISIARSDGDLLRESSEVQIMLAEVEHRQNHSADESLRRSEDLLEGGALVANPDDSDAYADMASVFLRRYLFGPLSPPHDNSILIDRVISSSSRAASLDPKNARALLMEGTGHIYRGMYDYFHGRPGTQWWQIAVTELADFVSLNPSNPSGYNALGNAHLWLGSESDKLGRDPSSDYELAIASYDNALMVNPYCFKSCANKTNVLVMMGEHEDSIGTDPSRRILEALNLGDRCLSMSKGSFVVLSTLARGEILLASRMLSSGQDPRGHLQSARAFIDKANELFPDLPELMFRRSLTNRIEAEYAYAHPGLGDPALLLNSSITLLNSVIREISDVAPANVELARVLLIKSRHADRHFSSAFLREAEDKVAKALQADSLLSDAHLVGAEIDLELSALSGDRGYLLRASRHVDAAAGLNPNSLTIRSLKERIVAAGNSIPS